MAITGVIASATRSKIPEAWQMCLSHPGFGEENLSRSIEITKYILFNTVVDPLQEELTYNPMVIEYVALMAAARIVPSAAEIINNASRQRTMFGQKNQQETWLDRYQNLMEQRKFLLEQAKELYPFIKDELDPVNTTETKNSPILYTEVLDNAVTDDPTQWDYTYSDRNDANPVERGEL